VVWKEAVIAKLKVLFWSLPGRVDGNYGRDNQFPGRYLNPVPTKYVVGGQITRSRRYDIPHHCLRYHVFLIKLGLRFASFFLLCRSICYSLCLQFIIHVHSKFCSLKLIEFPNSFSDCSVCYCSSLKVLRRFLEYTCSLLTEE
jgi:hypothetical protein